MLSSEEIAALSDDEKKNGVDPANYNGRYFVPYDKGGESDAEGGWLPNYHVPTGYFIDWSKAAVNRLKTFKSTKHADKVAARFQNSQYYFRHGITFSYTGFYAPNFRLSCSGVFDVGGSSCFELGIERELAMAYLASKLNRYIAKTIVDHTVNFQVDEFKELLLPSGEAGELSNQLYELVAAIIEKQKANPRYSYHLHEQKQIDALVYELYNLSPDDIREVELWYCRRYEKLARAQGVYDEAQTKYANHLARCQSIMAKPAGYWQSHPLLQTIAGGESATLEFKETLEADNRTGEKNPGVLQSALKTIAAFLNTGGGTLLIGVSDAGEIKGLQPDLRFVNGASWDGFQLKLKSLLKDRLEPGPLENVEITFDELPDGVVCRVAVAPQPREIITHFDRRDVFVRDGNQTLKLDGPALAAWIARRVSG